MAGDSQKTPARLHAEGGIGAASPGQTATSFENLPAGRYVVADVGGPSDGGGAHADLMVSPGQDGPLPATEAKVTGARIGKDRYAWRVSGLKVGTNRITFKSEGMDAIHFVGAVRIKSGNPSLAEIEKSLGSNAPPAFADPSSFQNTAVLDGGKSDVTTLTFKQPGRYVLFCPLSDRDRDGGKSHWMEGMLTKITVR